VLGHPARMKILQYMIKNTSCIYNDFVLELPLAQSTASKHLSELKAVGLIQGEIFGSKICYCIDRNVFNEIVVALNELIISNFCDNSNCC